MNFIVIASQDIMSCTKFVDQSSIQRKLKTVLVDILGTKNKTTKPNELKFSWQFKKDGRRNFVNSNNKTSEKRWSNKFHSSESKMLLLQWICEGWELANYGNITRIRRLRRTTQACSEGYQNCDLIWGEDICHNEPVGRWKTRKTYAQILLLTGKCKIEKIHHFVFLNYKLDKFLYSPHVIRNVAERASSKQSFQNIVQINFCSQSNFK